MNSKIKKQIKISKHHPQHSVRELFYEKSKILYKRSGRNNEQKLQNFTVKSYLIEKEGVFKKKLKVCKIVAEVNEMNTLLKILNVRLAPGPDGVLNWNLREFREQQAGKIQTLIMYQLNEGKMPLAGKSANNKWTIIHERK